MSPRIFTHRQLYYYLITDTILFFSSLSKKNQMEIYNSNYSRAWETQHKIFFSVKIKNDFEKLKKKSLEYQTEKIH